MNNTFCTEPWHALHLGHEGVFKPCCHLWFKSNIIPESKEDIMALFNAPEMVELREQFVSGEIKNKFCRACLEGYLLPKPTNTQDIDEIYRDHPGFAAEIGRAIREGQTKLDYFPKKLEVNLTFACNLKCIMCTQSPVDIPQFYKLYPSDRLIRAIEDMGPKNVAWIALVGGEPLATRDGTQLLRYLTHREFENTLVTITTNGTKIQDHLETIKRIQKLHLVFSIEGVGEVFEHVRPGAKWEEVKENYKTVMELSKSQEGLSCQHIMSIVMKSTIPCLPELMEFIGQNSGTINFVKCCGEFFRENVFFYPSLLEDVEWREYFDRAIEIGKKHGMTNECRALEEIGSDLAGRTSRPSPDIMKKELERIRKLTKGDYQSWNIGGRLKDSTISKDEIMLHSERFLRWLERGPKEIGQKARVVIEREMAV